MHARLAVKVAGTPMLYGAWYPVGYREADAIVRLAVNGKVFETSADLLEFDEQKRTWCVFGIQLEPEPMSVVVCPAGHHLQTTGLSGRVRCRRCVKDYDVLSEPVKTGSAMTAATALKKLKVPASMERRPRRARTGRPE